MRQSAVLSPPREWPIALVATLFLVGASPGADLRFDAPAVNLGKVRTGSTLRHEFTYVNAGVEDVVLLEASSSCGCVVPKLNRQAIPSGEKGSVALEVNTLTQPAGPRTWVLKVRYRDAKEARDAELRLCVELISEVAIQPATLVLMGREGLGHDITISDARSRPFGIAAVNPSSPALRATVGEVARTSEGKWLRKIRLELTPDCPEGRREEVVSIYTDDPDYREIKLPVTVLKRSRHNLEAAPSAVSLSAPRGQALPSRIVMLRDGEDRELRIVKVSADNPAILCKWSPDAAKTGAIRLSIDSAHPATEGLSGIVSIEVDKPASEVIHIPVRVNRE